MILLGNPSRVEAFLPELVLDHLKILGPNKDLSVIQPSRKLTMLMLLTRGQHGQALHLLDTKNMSISDFRVLFRIGYLLKTSRQDNHMSELGFEACPIQTNMCSHHNFTLLWQNKSYKRENNQFFLTTKPHKTGVTRFLRCCTRDNESCWHWHNHFLSSFH